MRILSKKARVFATKAKTRAFFSAPPFFMNGAFSYEIYEHLFICLFLCHAQKIRNELFFQWKQFCANRNCVLIPINQKRINFVFVSFETGFEFPHCRRIEFFARHFV